MRALPGFVSVKRFAADDGECVTIGEFETTKAVEDCREHAAHREAQCRGREAFHAEYRLPVAEAARDYGFQHDPRSV